MVAIVLLDSDGERIERSIVGRSDPPGELFPARREGKYDHGGESRPCQGQSDSPERAKNTTTIDGCRIEELLGYLFKKAAQQIHAKRHACCVDKDEAKSIIDQPQVACQDELRDDKDDGWHCHRSKHTVKQDITTWKMIACESKREHGCKEYVQKRSTTGHNSAVEKSLAKIVVGPGAHVVVQRGMGGNKG